MRSLSFRSTLIPLAVLASVVVSPQTVSAQDGFLFRQPVVGFTLRGGPLQYSMGGDLFEEMRSQLTLERGDFRTVTFGGDLVIMPSTRLDVVGSVMYASVESGSEVKRWTEWDEQSQQELPIEQSTRLRTVPISLSARYQLLPRTRRISALAHIPQRTTPYVGAGVGVTLYNLEQQGDFVDEKANPEAPPIFTEYLETRGSQATLHALVGVDHWFARAFGLNAEARYTHGSATPSMSYYGYDKLDLGGLQATLGLSFRW